MLNEKTKERELAYIVRIDEIKSIENYDRVEHARVNGWWVIVQKNQFKVGDMAIYIEIDSKVPSNNPAFNFLAKRDYKVKTLKMCKVLSQGLLMSLSDFPDIFEEDHVSNMGWVYKIRPFDAVKVGDFLTKQLRIVYWVAADNERKSKNPDKYARMAARYQKLFKNNKVIKWLYEKTWGKKLLFLFLGRKRDKKNNGWPLWVTRTDEERCQNLPQLFPGNGTYWIVTEKIDGSSTTFTMRRKGRKKEFYVCSRNVCFDTPEKEKKYYYDSNIYLEMAEKYNIKAVLEDMLNKNDELDFITIQGETYGAGVQKRDYKLEGHDFIAFNLIYGYKTKYSRRINSVAMTTILKEYNIPCVPILNAHYVLPQTCEELLVFADGVSKIDGEMREGIVLRTWDGEQSFKAVNDNYLLKYHQ